MTSPETSKTIELLSMMSQAQIQAFSYMISFFLKLLVGSDPTTWVKVQNARTKQVIFFLGEGEFMDELSHKSDQRGKTDISDLIMLNVNQQWETDGLWDYLHYCLYLKRHTQSTYSTVSD